MSKKELVFIGGGGLSYEILEVADQLNYSVLGYFDDKETSIDLHYLGTLENYYANSNSYTSVFLTIGCTNNKTSKIRQNIITNLQLKGVEFPNLISPHAVISQGVFVGCGTFVAHGVVLSVDCVIGNFCIVNTAAVIGHHSIIGDNVTVGPMVFIGGNVIINNNVVLGATAKVLQDLVLGESCVIGVGSTVLKNLKDKTTVWPLLNKQSRGQSSLNS